MACEADALHLLLLLQPPLLPREVDAHQLLLLHLRSSPSAQMRLEQGQPTWSDLNHNNEVKKTGRMPYVCVRENATKWWVSVHGLNHHEVRLLSEKVSDQPETHDDREKLVEFSIPSWQVLLSLVLVKLWLDTTCFL